MTVGDIWGRFGRWRQRRPFWGCLFLLLSGAELFFTANQTLAGLSVHLGPTGFLSYLLPLILLICSLLCLFSPAQRLFYGIVGLLAALYSFIGLNLGGFFIGMLLGIVGGALVIAWGPPRVKPADPAFVPIADQLTAEQAAVATTDSEADVDSDADSDAIPATDDEPATAPVPASASGWDSASDSDSAPSSDSDSDSAPASASAETEHIEIAGHDDRPAEDSVRPVAAPEPGLVPGFDDHQEGPKSGRRRGRLAKNPKALTVALIVVGLTAGMLAVGSRVPANADDACPKGMPSRTATTTATAAAEKAAAGTAATSRKTTSKKKTTGTPATKATPKTGTPAVSPSASATASGSGSESGSGNQILDGVKDFFDGVGNLLGLGDDPSPSPSASPSPSETPTAAPTKTSDPAPTKTTEPKPTTTTEPTKAASAPASPTAGGDVIPCLGARVLGLDASADDVPPVAAKAGLLETDLLTMYDSTYDGVVNLPTVGGSTIRALKFSMSKATNKPFSLTINEPGGATTAITSDDLATTGTVKFYTERFEGKLFGLIPVVFTPDQPPPLTLPILWFTDVKIQLNYVRCDQLTGIPLQINEKQ